MDYFRVRKPPCLIVLGSVGSGKSTLLSRAFPKANVVVSSSITSETRAANLYNKKMYSLYDTPGLDSIFDSVQQNMVVAHAISAQALNGIILVCTCDRIENAIKEVRPVITRFDSYKSYITILVNKTENWTPQEKKKASELMVKFLKVKAAMCVSILTDHVDTIVTQCFTSAFRIPVSKTNFFKLFSPSIEECLDSQQANLKLMQEKFDMMHSKYLEMFEAVNSEGTWKTPDEEKKIRADRESKQVDLTFAYKEYIKDEIPKLKKELMVKAGLTLLNNPSELALVSMFQSHMESVLIDVNIICENYSKNVETDFRECQHCGRVWTKVEGCDGATTCGKTRLCSVDSKASYNRFSFNWVNDNFVIAFNPYSLLRVAAETVGCGNQISWSTMKPVKVDSDFYAKQPYELVAKDSIIESEVERLLRETAIEVPIEVYTALE